MSTSGARSPGDWSEREYAELLLRAGEILSGALDWHDTVAAACDAVVETIADLCFLYMKDESGALYLAAMSGAHPEAVEALRKTGVFVGAPLRATPLVQRALESGEALCLPHLDEQTLRSIARGREHEQFMRGMAYHSIAVVPVVTKTRGILGALAVVRTNRTPVAFDERSLRYVRDFAKRCANAIGKAMLFEQTQRIATVYQQAALPARLPVARGIGFDAFYEPSSEELLVGGDWYDAFALQDGRIAITIGDVLGHGLEAAVWMSRLRNGFRAALFGEPDPERSLEIVDYMLRAETEDDFFTTALVALVDPARQTLTCASAGHPGPLVWNGKDGTTDPFADRGLPLGLRQLCGVTSVTQTIDVHAGSFAVFFTDGLLEWNRDIASSWQALQEAIELPRIREARRPAQALHDAVIGNAPHQDDVAILTVRWDHTRFAG